MELLQALAEWPLAAFIRQSAIAYPLVNALHILSIGLLIGSIVTLDLRVLGFFPASRLDALGPPLVRVAGVGVGLAVVTGFLLFSVRPVAYVQNPAFLIKLALLALGIANALVLRSSRGWRRALDGGAIARSVRLMALASLAIWPGAVVAGRWIGFLQ